MRRSGTNHDQPDNNADRQTASAKAVYSWCAALAFQKFIEGSDRQDGTIARADLEQARAG